MSLTVQQLLSDAKRLTGRLRDHDSSADTIITAAQDVLKEVEAMRQYQEDIESLNNIAHNRPRAQLVLGIQQENRHIRQLQHENKELRAALEEHQNVLELIMSKYRQHMSCLINSTKLEKDMIIHENTRMLQDRADKICEMANVMQKSIQIDEQSINKEQELMARLVTENKGLREMLEISHRNGSYSNPCVGPRLVSTGCQTEVEAETSPPDHPSPASGDLAFKIINKFSSPIKSANNCTSNCQTQNGIENPNVVSGERGVGDKAEMRPLSSASEESESSSISEDDEISFNTIKRQIAPKSKCDSSTVTTNTNLSNGSSVKNNGSSTECLEIDNNNGLNGDVTNDKQMNNSNTVSAAVTETIVES